MASCGSISLTHARARNPVRTVRRDRALLASNGKSARCLTGWGCMIANPKTELYQTVWKLSPRAVGTNSPSIDVRMRLAGLMVGCTGNAGEARNSSSQSTCLVLGPQKHGQQTALRPPQPPADP